jgi:hypothetical protein
LQPRHVWGLTNHIDGACHLPVGEPDTRDHSRWRYNRAVRYSNVNNVDAVLEKLPNAEVERWIEYSSGLMDNQLATALEKFVTERWTYATTLVSRTTSADQEW